MGGVCRAATISLWLFRPRHKVNNAHPRKAYKVKVITRRRMRRIEPLIINFEVRLPAGTGLSAGSAPEHQRIVSRHPGCTPGFHPPGGSPRPGTNYTVA